MLKKPHIAPLHKAFLSELRNENSLNLNRLRMGSRTSNMAQFIPASSLKIKGLGQKDVLTP